MALTPHVITYLNKFVRDEDAYAVEMAYDAKGRLLMVTSVREDATEINSFRRAHLAQWVSESCEAFIEWAGIELGGGVLGYSPEGGMNRGK